jgi:SET family sugar efflux transporter-like MFS transporter
VVVGLPRVPAAAATARTESGAPAPAVRRALLYLVIASLIAAQTAQTLNVQAMPLFVSSELGGSIRDAGLVLGLCAALEIPLMLGFGALATRVPLRRLIIAGSVCAIVYQLVATLATAVWMLAAAQVLQAVVIATVAGLGISYVQDLLPSQPGRATTLVSNTFPIGQVLAAPLFGLAQHFGFRLAYGLNLALCVLGLLLLLASGRVRPASRTEPAPA